MLQNAIRVRWLGIAALMLLCSLSFAFTCTAPSGTCRYVATTGTDSGNCSDNSTPCLTINYTLGQANANDTVYVFAGAYSENVTIDKAGLQLRGEGAANTTINASSGNTVRISASDVTLAGFRIAANATSYSIYQNGQDRSIIRDCIITRGIICIRSNTGTSATFINNTFSGISGTVVSGSNLGHANTLLFYNNLFYSNGIGIDNTAIPAATVLENNTFANMSTVLSGSNGQMKNNIFSGITCVSNGASRTVQSTYDLFSGVVAENCSGTLLNRTGDLSTSPMFVDYNGNNYSLACGSPAINSSPTGTYNRGWYQGPCADVYSGPIWYVSMAGNDSTGDGSQANPVRTIQKGVYKSPPGDTVLVGAGAYSENVIIDKVLLQVRGEGAANTTINASSGNTVRISASDVTLAGFRIAANATSYSIYQNGQDRSIIRDCIITRGVYCVRSNTGTSATFINNTFTGISGTAVLGSNLGNANTLLFYNNLFYSNGIGIDNTAIPAATVLENNTFANMSTVLSGSNGQMRNNIFSGITCVSNGAGRTVQSTYNLFSGVVAENCSGTLLNRTGDLNASPVFFDYNGNDYRLACGSPAYMTGSNNATSMGWYQGLEVPA
ncbi:MAG: hypothetical protein PHV13_05150, partial [Candidatus ainarchaeum sp.]|nr:hypothetical protein [Candidatus ainarchaeum sp.]